MTNALNTCIISYLFEFMKVRENKPNESGEQLVAQRAALLLDAAHKVQSDRVLQPKLEVLLREGSDLLQRIKAFRPPSTAVNPFQHPD